ncbi:hypothetical protein WG66_011432, partial [Moniliophthora roreri]
ATLSCQILKRVNFSRPAYSPKTRIRLWTWAVVVRVYWCHKKRILLIQRVPSTTSCLPKRGLLQAVKMHVRVSYDTYNGFCLVGR